MKDDPERAAEAVCPGQGRRQPPRRTMDCEAAREALAGRLAHVLAGRIQRIHKAMRSWHSAAMAQIRQSVPWSRLRIVLRLEAIMADRQSVAQIAKRAGVGRPAV